jgi:hypothetical protein
VTETLPGLEMVQRLWVGRDRIVANVLLGAAIIVLLQVVNRRRR